MFRREAKTSLFLFIFSLSLHLVLFLSSKDFFNCYPPSLDEDFYFLLVQLYHEKSLLIFKEPFYYSPLFFYILVALSHLTPDYIYAIKFINIFLGSLIPPFVFMILIHLNTPKKIALLITLAYAFTDIFLLYNLSSMKVTLGIFLFTLFLFFFIKKNFFLSGLFLGLAVLIYGGLLLVYSVLLFLLIIKRFFKSAFIFSIPLFLVLALTSYINYSRSGDVILITAIDGVHFFIGNWKNATGIYTPVPGIRPNPFGHYFDAKSVAEFIKKEKNLKPSEVSKFWKELAFKHIKENKVRALKLYLRKLLLTFNFKAIPNNYYLPEIRKRTLLKFSIPFQVWLILGLTGLFLSLREKERNIFLYAILLGSVAYLMLFFVTDRYRLPVIFLLILFSRHVFLSLNRNSLKKLLYSIVISIVIVFAPINSFRFNSEKYFNLSQTFCSLRKNLYIPDKLIQAKAYEQLGDFYVKVGGKEWAIFYYKKALDLNPRSKILKKKLFNLYFQ